MFCYNCGKEVKENDNFCRYCGTDLRQTVTIKVEEKIQDDTEEIVLYDVKKHCIDLVLPAFLTPLFFLYFWNIFLNTHSLFSWVVIFTILGFIFYPIARYKSDRMVITNKFVHIKSGVINPEEIDIPLSEINVIELTQSTMGRMFDYGFVTYSNFNEKRSYGSVKAPEELQYIIDNPEKFVEENIN